MNQQFTFALPIRPLVPVSAKGRTRRGELVIVIDTPHRRPADISLADIYEQCHVSCNMSIMSRVTEPVVRKHLASITLAQLPQRARAGFARIIAQQGLLMTIYLRS